MPTTHSKWTYVRVGYRITVARERLPVGRSFLAGVATPTCGTVRPKPAVRPTLRLLANCARQPPVPVAAIIPSRVSTSRPILSAAKRIAACTLLSRVTGLVRDILLAQAFALSWIQDAFVYAFQIPNLFRRLLGEGAMVPVFVPTFTRTIEQRGRAAAWRLLGSTLGLMTAAIVVLIAVLELLLMLAALFSPADPTKAAARQMLLALTSIMLPFMLPICMLALLSSVLNCLGKFTAAAAAPIVLNLFMIAGIAVVGPLLAPDNPGAQVYIVAVMVVFGGVAQLLVLIPTLLRSGVRCPLHMTAGDPAVRDMLKLLPPVALGQGVLAFGVFLDAQVCTLLTRLNEGPSAANWFGLTFAYPLTEGALSAVTYAQRLYQFPLGVLAISLATAALPTFSRLAARKDWSAWAGEVRGSIRLGVFEGLLAGVILIVLAEPIVRLLFQYDRFGAADTQRTAAVLRWYGYGLWAFCAQHMVLRAFYSLGDVRTPLRLAAAALPLSAVLNLTLVWFDAIRESAFAISSVVSSAVIVGIGCRKLARRASHAIIDATARSALFRMLLAAAVAGGVGVLAGGGAADPAEPHHTEAEQPVAESAPASAAAGATAENPDVLMTVVGRAVETFAQIALVSFAFVGVAWVLRLPEVGAINPLRRRREPPAASATPDRTASGPGHATPDP